MIRPNPQSAIRNSKQIRMVKIQNSQRGCLDHLDFRSFGFVSDLEFRIYLYPTTA
jgi:hypothetical protein